MFTGRRRIKFLRKRKQYIKTNAQMIKRFNKNKK